MRISVIIPVFNEEKSIANLHAEIVPCIEALTKDYEIIYINDGSTDSSIKEIEKLNSITLINLQRRYGQATALDAGFKHATGDIVVTLDADGQNDPRDIANLIELLHAKQYDVVAGWRVHRRDPFLVRVFTRVGRFLRIIFIADPIHDAGCSLRVYNKASIKSLDIGGEMHRYILTLLRWKGYRIGEKEVHHRERLHGSSKYGITKTIRGLIDLLYIWFIYKYSERPLHLFGYISFGAFAGGVITGMWSVYGKIMWNLSLNRNGWFFITGFLFLASVICFSFGIVIDLLMRIHTHVSPFEKRYYIKNIVRT